MWYYQLTLHPSEAVIGPVDRNQLLQLIRSGTNPRISPDAPASFTVHPIKVAVSIEPVLTEVHAGFFVTLRHADGTFIRNSQLFSDRWTAEAHAADLEMKS
ncbi:hypothetical protein EBZ80_25235 [bacterium]|nr:hypothetical protein [bacterium]